MAASTEGNKKTHEVVADELRRRIVGGDLQIGDRLPAEEELNKQFGIARTTLREALRVLESQGLLEIRRGRGGGPVVTEPSLEPAATALAVTLQLQKTTLADLDEVRTLLEGHAVARWAKHHEQADLEALEVAIAFASEAAEAGDPAMFADAAINIHETVLQHSGNTTLTTMSGLLHKLVKRYYVTAAAELDRKTMRRAVRSYRRLLELIQSHDAEGATTHWWAHMAYTIDRRAGAKLEIFG